MEERKIVALGKVWGEVGGEKCKGQEIDYQLDPDGWFSQPIKKLSPSCPDICLKLTREIFMFLN